MQSMPDSQMCLTFAGDEAGDASFSFDEGASTHFVLVLIATAQPDTLREALARLREQRGLPADYEFKHYRLSSAALRHAVIEALQVLDFEVYALAVDKVTLPVYLRTLDTHSFYALLAAELIPSKYLCRNAKEPSCCWTSSIRGDERCWL